MSAKEEFMRPRVRFAPAPTGFLHVGGARTALFNWLIARKYGGVFVLRIEDTDRERSRPEFVDDILGGLRWLGLDWDEGPDIGGPYGPYRQSERSHIYQKHLRRLLEGGHAYYCFCEESDLEAERQDNIARGVPPKYSGRCRGMSAAEVEEKLRRQGNPLIRIRMPEKKVKVFDLIRGSIEFDMALFGDIPIARGLDSPLFIFAVTVDDHEMTISHVIRGEDLLPNTPKQIVLQEMLGFPHPAYGHLPILLGADRAKLSKRHGATSIQDHRAQGYLPEAMVNFLALLGWHPADDREFYSLGELKNAFTLERVQKAGAVFMTAKLRWMNAHYIREMPLEKLLERAVPFWKQAGFTVEEFPRDYLVRVLSVARERLDTLEDLPGATEFFFKEPEYAKGLLAWKDMKAEELPEILRSLSEAIASTPDDLFDGEHLKKAIEPLLVHGKGRVLWPLRAALSGREASPGPYEIALILGKARVVRRLRYAQDRVRA